MEFLLSEQRKAQVQQWDASQAPNQIGFHLWDKPRRTDAETQQIETRDRKDSILNSYLHDAIPVDKMIARIENDFFTTTTTTPSYPEQALPPYSLEAH